MELVTINLPWKPTHVVPVGDIQWAGKDYFSVAEGYLRETIARALEYEKAGDTVLFLGMGDYIDFMSPSNRARTEAANLYDTALDILDKTALFLNEELMKVALQPTVGKWLGLVAGHHYRKMETGVTSDMELCRELKARFLGSCALIRLNFKDRNTSMPAILWVHHGTGSGQTGYYPLSRLEKVAATWEDVDVFLMGHTTKQAIEWQNRIKARWFVRRGDGPDLTHRTIRLVGTGGYSKTYAEYAGRTIEGVDPKGKKVTIRRPEGGYAEKRMLSASVLGSPIVHITPKRDWQDGAKGRVLLDIRVEG